MVDFFLEVKGYNALYNAIYIELLVKCPFYKKLNKKKPTLILLLNSPCGIWGANIYEQNLVPFWRSSKFGSVNLTLEPCHKCNVHPLANNCPTKCP